MCEIIRIMHCPGPHACVVFTLVAENIFIMANSAKQISLPTPLLDGDPMK